MTWGPYYFFYHCPNCGEKYRIALDNLDDSGTGRCPSCQTAGTLVGESKDVPQGENPFAAYEETDNEK